jgi:hypothetical protein
LFFEVDIVSGPMMICTTAITGSVLAVILIKRLKKVGWDYCPQTPASLETAHVIHVSGWRGSYRAELYYHYSVEGLRSKGVYSRWLPTEADAIAFLDECEKRELVAAYKPESPSESRLLVVPEIKSLGINPDDTSLAPEQRNISQAYIDLAKAFLCCECESIGSSAKCCPSCGSQGVIHVARLVPHHKNAIRMILASDTQNGLAA